MFTWILSKWSINDPLPASCDAIVPISYGSTRDRLTKASKEVVSLTKDLSQKFPTAKIFWGDFANNTPSDTEFQKKSTEFMLSGIYIGKVTSSTDECEAVAKKINETSFSFEKIIVIADASHARRCRLVWRSLIPDKQIYFLSIPAHKAEDSENPMIFQRNWRIWLLVNMALFPFYKFFPGVKWFAKRNFQQPSI